VITIALPPRPLESLAFEVSPLAETVHSWHVLMRPGHHALQVPWVRRCRDLPADVRAGLRDWGWLVEDYVPAIFEAGGDDGQRHFDDELKALSALAPTDIAADLARCLLVDLPWEGPELLADTAARAAAIQELGVRDPTRRDRLIQVLADPSTVLNEATAVVARYWESAFAAEWRRLEPQLWDDVAQAGTHLPNGVWPLLKRLVPEIRVDASQGRFSLDRPHDHERAVNAGERVAFTPSFYGWPHVRVTCDPPWQLRITYPVLPPSPHARRATSAEAPDLLPALRALAAEGRLDIVRLLREQPRSTQELAGLLGLSAAAISRHLQQLRTVGIVDTRRTGYYVVYHLRSERLRELADQLAQLSSSRF
jgi:DNA-binding transcriptional ArsR family regulator